jgi:predicted HTH domain antitoxin
LFLAFPFDELLLKCGVNVDLAVHLFDTETISLGQAAKLAGMPLPVFMDHLKHAGVPVARPRPAELEQELAAFGD